MGISYLRFSKIFINTTMGFRLFVDLTERAHFGKSFYINIKFVVTLLTFSPSLIYPFFKRMELLLIVEESQALRTVVSNHYQIKNPQGFILIFTDNGFLSMVSLRVGSFTKFS